MKRTVKPVTDARPALRIYMCNEVGCESTHLEGLRVIRFLVKNDHQLTESPEEADYIVLNTCAFVPSQRVAVVERLKTFGQLAPRVPIIVMGCARDIAPEILKDHAPALVCSHHDLDRLNQLFQRTHPLQTTAQFEWSDQFRRVIVPTGRGCANNCSYCSIKKSTGHIHSRPVETIVADFRAALAKGHGRFLLAADDLGSYGLDIGTGLPELLRSVDSLKDPFTVLLSNIHPRWFVQYLKPIKVFLSSAHGTKWLFLPIQSASQSVLDSMNRNHSIDAVARALESLIEAVPAVRLYYDVMVGFPTETEEGFNDTLSFVLRYPPSCLTISPFAPETDTPAARLTPLDPRVVSARVDWLRTIHGYALAHSDRVSEGMWGEE